MIAIKTIRGFRQDFGLGQSDLPKLLQTTRSLVALVERDRRLLPLDAEI